MSQRDDAPDWVADEAPLLPAMMQDIKRLARRARRRWGWVLLLTLLLVAMPAYVIWLRNTPKVATISMAFVPRNGLGYSNREVRAYVESVLLSRQNLYGLIEAYELVPGLQRRDMDTVVDMLRGRIDVQAVAQYAPEDALGEQSPGARVRITITHAQAAIASRLADGLVAKVLETEQARRQDQAEAQRGALVDKRVALAASRHDLTSRLAALTQQLAASDRASVQGRQLALDVGLLREQIDHLDAVGDEMLRLSVEQAYVTGLVADARSELTVLDVSHPATGNQSRFWLQVGISMITLLLCGLIAAALIAAFDHRIDAPADVLRLGAVGLGTWRAPEARA